MTAVPKPKRMKSSKRKRNPQMQRDCIDRDGGCLLCGLTDDTNVGHHIHGFGAGGPDELSNMITLCFQCHDNAGRGYIDWLRVNPPMKKYLPEPKGMIGFHASDKGSGPKIWECDTHFKTMIDGEYGYVD